MRSFFAPLVLVSLATASLQVHGQAVAFLPGTPSTVTTGVNIPVGTAVDSSGNVYIADFNDSRVLEYVSSTGSVNTLLSGLNGVEAVALDGLGNLYVGLGSGGNSQGELLQVELSNCTTICPYSVILGSSAKIQTVTALAVDSSNNVYVAGNSNAANNSEGKPYLLELNSSGQQIHTYSFSGATYYTGVAVDAAGDVFVSDIGGKILELIAATNKQATLFNNSSNSPAGIGLDQAGNLYFADTNTFGLYLLLKTKNGYGKATEEFVLSAPPYNLATPYGFSVAANANLYVSYGTNASNSGILKIDRTKQAVSFGTVATGTTSAAQTVTVMNAGSATLTGTTSLTGSDFAVTQQGCGGTKTLNLAPGATCTLSFTFSPLIPYTYTATENLVDNAPNSPQQIQLTGTGSGAAVIPQLAFLPGTETVLTSQVNIPVGTVSDSSGDLYIADFGNSRVIERLANGTIKTLLTGLNGVEAVALDGLGNLYVGLGSGGNSAGELLEIPLSSCSTACTSTIVAGGPSGNLQQVTAVATDGNNNVYFGGNTNSSSGSTGPAYLAELNSNGTLIQTFNFTGTSYYSGIVLDSAGDLFVSDIYGLILEMPAGSMTQTTIFNNGSYSPAGLGIDLNGDLYFADTNMISVYEISKSQTGYATSPTLLLNLAASPYNLPTPFGFSVDQSGDFYISYGTNTSNSGVLKIDRSTESINFGTVSGGTTSSQTVTIESTGNGPLTGSLSISGTGFTLSSNTCGASYTLPAGNSCMVTITFTPTATKNYSGTVTFTNDAFNSPQKITLKGAGLLATTSQLSFLPGVASTLTTAVNIPVGTAVDASGNVYIADFNNSRVVEYQASSGTLKTLLTGLNGVEAVAIDGLNNLYVALGSGGNSEGELLKVPLASCSTTCTSTVLLGGPSGTLQTGTALAVDNNNNVYFAGNSNTSGGAEGPTYIAELNTSGKVSKTFTFTGSTYVTGLAVDLLGDVFLSDASGLILENVKSSGNYVTLYSNSSSSPAGIGLDAARDVYFVDTISEGIFLIPINGSTYGTATKLLSLNQAPYSIASPYGFSVDANASFYVSYGTSGTNSGILKIDRTTESLNFGTVATGSTSAPQTVTIMDTGAAALTGSGSLSGSAFSVTSSTCGATTLSLQPGASCSESFTFTPPGQGTYTGDQTLTDNAPNTPQQISLTGMGASPGVINLPQTKQNYGNVNVGSSQTSNITLINQSSTVGQLSYTITGTNAADFTVTSNGCASGVPVGSGGCQIAVKFAPTMANTVESAQVNFTSTNSTFTPQAYFSLVGTGVAAGQFTISGSPHHSFGTVDVGSTSPAYGVKVSNSYSYGITLTYSLPDTTNFTISSNTCGPTGSVLAAGKYCNFAFEFTPQTSGPLATTFSLSGTQQGTSTNVPLTYQDGTTPFTGQSLTGTGQSTGQHISAKPMKPVLGDGAIR